MDTKIKMQDFDMPFMLKFENVAWYEDGVVKILDRRVYPRQVRFEICKDYRQVAKAIKDMVTQSAGPYTAAAMAMALASYQVKDENLTKQNEFMKQAAYDLSHARITTVNRMSKITEGSYNVWKQALKDGKDPTQEIFMDTLESLNRRYYLMDKVGKNFANLVKNNDHILTQCFGETIIGTLFRNLREQNKDVKVYCAETRPYFQGAKLTATCTSQMGFDTTILSDNMIAYAMKNEKIDIFTSAADTITRDGHVANKVGTLQIAILSDYFSVPYYVSGIPDSDKFTKDDIKIELREPNEVLCANKIRHTIDGVKALYPSFDITNPKLINAVITDKGVYSPYNLEEYFKGNQERFY